MRSGVKTLQCCLQIFHVFVSINERVVHLLEKFTQFELLPRKEYVMGFLFFCYFKMKTTLVFYALAFC